MTRKPVEWRTCPICLCEFAASLRPRSNATWCSATCRGIGTVRTPSAPPMWTAERCSLLAARYPRDEPVGDIRAALNALPGVSVTAAGIRRQVRKLKLTRSPAAQAAFASAHPRLARVWREPALKGAA